MKPALHVTFLSVGVLLSLFTACSKRDTVINIAEDDPEMVAAIAKARDSLPQFWAAFDQRQRGDTDFSLKVKITGKRGTEHFWLKEIERRDGQVYGTIDNAPDIVRHVKRGARIPIPEADISDSFYMRDHKMVVNYTSRVLFRTMTAAEVKRYQQIMADP